MPVSARVLDSGPVRSGDFAWIRKGYSIFAGSGPGSTPQKYAERIYDSWSWKKYI